MIPFLMALLCFGCQGQEVVEAPKPPQTPPPSEVKESEPVEPVQNKDPRYKAERVHQLKDLATRTLKVGPTTLTVWLMDDGSKRAEGMMWLEPKDVKDREGMLFVFNDSQPRSFWMQNCPLGLDIIYIDAKGKVVSIGAGKPFDESGVPSKGPAKYVLELKSGKAKQFGIKTGTQIPIPKDVKSKDGG